MTDSLATLINYSYRYGKIPSSWEESAVVSLHKDGDLADPGNYRGISLMSTTLKVVAVMLSDRINRAGELRGLFAQNQAGFRTREEAVTQAACVVDVLRRRQIMGMESGDYTYAVFIDLQKAYDTVPHEALFAKLSRFGVRGRCLKFIRSLYCQSSITVRLGGGKTAQYSHSFPLKRGVRQG